MKARIGLALFAMVSICLGAAGSAEKEWRVHIDRAEGLLGNFKRAVSDDEILAAEREYAFAVEVARKAGLPRLALDAYAGQVDCLEALCDYVPLRDLQYEILEYQESLGEEWARAVAITWQDLGYVESLLLNFDAAFEYLHRAEEFFIRTKDADELAQTRARLANACNSAGDPGLALANAEAALGWFLETGDSLSAAETLAALAAALRGIGRVKEARQCLADVRKHDPEGEVVPDGWWKLGFVRLHLTAGEPGRARKAAAEAHAWFAREGDRLLLFFLRLLRARIEVVDGKPDAALAFVEKALTDETLTRTCRRRGLLVLGDVLWECGRSEEARDAYRRALELATNRRDGTVIVGCHAGLAALSLEAGDLETAWTHAERSVAAISPREWRESAPTSIGERGRVAGAIDVALRVAIATKRPERLFSMIERTRAGTLVDRIGAREAFLDRDLPVEFHERLTEARAQVVVAKTAYERAARGGNRPEKRAAEESYDAARRHYRLALDPLQRGSPVDMVAGRVPTLALEEARDSLDVGDAMVLYAVAEGRLHAVTVTSESASFVDLGETDGLSERVGELWESVVKGADSIDRDPVREALLDPVGLPPGCRRLLVSPVGPVATVPFALLVPDLEVTLIPSATSHALLVRRAREFGSEVGRDMLAMGDPVYSDELIRRTELTYRGTVLRRLEHTRKEVRETTGPGDVVLLGRDATERGLRREVTRRARWRAVHIASHGLFDRKRPLWSAMALSPERDEDGYLTVLEVYGMRIPTDLAVLSACGTGRGREVRGEGQLGLPAAFLYAGASRVLASLWDVEDEPSCIFMREFHRAWKKGPRAAEALEKARQAVRKAGYEHPRYWAGWVLWGIPD